MPRGDDRIAWQRENLFHVVAVLVLVGDQAAAHGAGEHRVAADGERPGQAGHEIGGLPRRVTPGEEGLYGDTLEVKGLVLAKGPASRKGLRCSSIIFLI